jgi:hypothetical protein
MQNKLKTMRTKNPKEFWKILNKGKRKEQPNIPVDTFFEFYKLIFNCFCLIPFVFSFQFSIILSLKFTLHSKPWFMSFTVIYLFSIKERLI